MTLPLVISVCGVGGILGLTSVALAMGLANVARELRRIADAAEKRERRKGERRKGRP